MERSGMEIASTCLVGEFVSRPASRPRSGGRADIGSSRSLTRQPFSSPFSSTGLPVHENGDESG